MSISGILEDADEMYDEIEELYNEKRQLEAEIADQQQKIEDSVVIALYEVQDSLEDEEYTLMHSMETGRGGSYTFDEVLTPEGVEAQNVSRNGDSGHESSEMWLWPGAWDSYDEPLDIEDEYLVGDRDSQGFLRKLHKGLRGDKVPESSFFYD